MTRAPAAIHAARLARDEARISADLARLGPAASKDPAALGESVDALLARPRLVVAWECWRCGDRHETTAAPQKVGGRPYCGPCVDHVRGVERESGPAPVAREPIQADTSPEAPAYPIGQQSAAPAPTVAAEEGENEMPTKPKPERACGCGTAGPHKASCKLAPKQTPVTCEDCGKPFPSRCAWAGHRKNCPGRKGAKGATPAKKTPAEPAADTREEAALDALAVAAMRFPGKEIPEPPSLRCLVVRVRGAVPLEVECATPEDAAAFVRLVSAGGVS